MPDSSNWPCLKKKAFSDHDDEKLFSNWAYAFGFNDRQHKDAIKKPIVLKVNM